MTIHDIYHALRSSPVMMFVGDNAKRTLEDARTIHRFQELENAGLARITSEFDDDPDPSFYDTWTHLSKRSRQQLKQEYCEDCYVVIAQVLRTYQTKNGKRQHTEWETVDSIGGCSGYKDPASPFHNCYVVDMMREAIKQIEEDATE